MTHPQKATTRADYAGRHADFRSRILPLLPLTRDPDEATVLAAVLFSPEFAGDVTRTLWPGDFTTPLYSELWRMARSELVGYGCCHLPGLCWRLLAFYKARPGMGIRRDLLNLEFANLRRVAENLHHAEDVQAAAGRLVACRKGAA